MVWWLISLDRLVLSAAGYDNGHECNWLLMCSPSDCESNNCVPEVSFSAFQLEANWDFVTLYDGETVAESQLARCSGSSCGGGVGTSNMVLAQMTSDGSVTQDGFVGSYSCIAAPDCTMDDLVLDWAGGMHASGHALFGSTGTNDADWAGVNVVVADPLNGCMGCDTLTGSDCQPSGTFADGSMDGKIALIQRGACYFTTKVTNAQLAGAFAAIIYNDSRPGIVNMSPAAAERRGTDGWNVDVEITIPGIFIEGVHGTALNEALTANPDEPVTLHCGDASYHSNPCGSPGANNLAEPGAVQVACGQTFGRGQTSTALCLCLVRLL